MITSNDLKNGMTIVLDGVLHQVIEFQHIKPGKGHAFVRTKLRKLDTGAVIDRTFRAKEPIEQAVIERRPLEYLYRDSSGYHFMDNESYEQVTVDARLVEPITPFLKGNFQVNVAIYNGEVIEVMLPAMVDLKVVEAAPGVKGDTVSSVTKPVRLETGATIQAPMFVEAGQVIRVDTRTGEYVTRV